MSTMLFFFLIISSALVSFPLFSLKNFTSSYFSNACLLFTATYSSKQVTIFQLENPNFCNISFSNSSYFRFDITLTIIIITIIAIISGIFFSFLLFYFFSLNYTSTFIPFSIFLYILRNNQHNTPNIYILGTKKGCLFSQTTTSSLF